MKEIILRTGEKTIVDDSDYEYLNKWTWNLAKRKNTNYAARREGEKTILMHRVLLNINDTKILADHVDGDGLNNQRINIRVANRTQNNSNRKAIGISKYLGVFYHSYDSRRKRWYSQIFSNGKKTFIGYFETEEEAALAYNNKAKIIHGKFAKLNQINA